MPRRLGALAACALTACALTACALATTACAVFHREPPPAAPAPDAATGAPSRIPRKRCPPNTPCAPPPGDPHRQYYDGHQRRYYYYDPSRGSYFWESGEAKP